MSVVHSCQLVFWLPDPSGVGAKNVVVLVLMRMEQMVVHLKSDKFSEGHLVALIVPKKVELFCHSF